MSAAPAPRPQAAEEARGGGAREPRAVAGVLRRHGHPAHVSLHRALRDEPGGQGEVRRPGQPACRRASAPRSPRCPARRPRARCSTRCPRAVDIAAGIAPGHEGRRRPRSTPPPRRPPPSGPSGSPPRPQGAYDELAAARDADRGRAGRGRLRRRRALRDRRARPRRAHRRRRRPLRRRGGRPAPRGPGDPGRRRPDPDRPAERAARRGPRQPPAGHRRRAVAVELGAVGLPRDAPCCAYLAGDGVPEPRMSATGYSLDPAAGARDRPARPSPSTVASTSSSCPPPRQRPTPCCRASTPPHQGVNAMSTKEKTAETDEADGKGGKKKLILILARRAPRRGRGGVLLPVLRVRRGRGRGARVQRHVPRRSSRSRSTWPAAAT